MFPVRPVLAGLVLLSAPVSGGVPLLDGGHLKAAWLTASYPDDSLFRDAVGAVAHDQAAELRLKFRAQPGPLQLQADYQWLARQGDGVSLAADFDDLFLLPPVLPDDDRRWWDLTHEISSSDNSAVVQRLDRLSVSWAGEKAFARFGRQAVSWGNGLIYNPMDFFNPFDPAAVDTEYKIGDDMFYGQYLLDSGNDWQLVNVQRRDQEGDVSSSVSSTALKFHGFGLDREFDLLLAEHFDQTLLGGGGVVNVGESVLRGDVMFTDAEEDWVTSLVVNWSYSWVWHGLNISGVAEYFFNGFGLREFDYSVEKIIAAQDLVRRIERGELFTLGRHYLAGSLMVEVTPLVNLTPNLFYNMGDGSALAQLVLQWDLAQNWQVLGALNVPVGPSGTEYGGLETDVEGLTLGSGPGFFLQAAFYF